MRREALSLLLCCGSVSLPPSPLPASVWVCVWLPGCVCVYTVYIYPSWEVIASFSQQRSSVQEEGLSCSGSINSSISSTNCFIRLFSFPSSPSPFSLPPPTSFGGLIFIFLLLLLFIFLLYIPCYLILRGFFLFFFFFSFPLPLRRRHRNKHAQTQRNKGKKSTGTYPAAANPKIADEERVWLLPQGKALPPLPPRHLLRGREGERAKGAKVEKSRSSAAGIWSTGSREVKDGCGYPSWLQGSSLPLDFHQH